MQNRTCGPKVCDNLWIISIGPLQRVRTKYTSCDTKTSHEIVCERECGRLPLKGRPVRLNESIDGDSNNEVNIEPINVFVPVGTRNGLLRDVRFLGVVFLVSIWLRSFSHSGRCLWLWLHRCHDVVMAKVRGMR